METTSGGLSRLDWVLNQKVDVFVLELGANDGLRGIELSQTKQNLQAHYRFGLGEKPRY
ncbi:MAG: acyl-CoA thioesterase-1 [Arcticibacterium sp.]